MGQEESRLFHGISRDLKTINADSAVQVTINNVMYRVSKDIPSGTSLNTFIREEAKLKGTKFMCLEGGCGACIVTAEINGQVMSVNSCLVPIFICDGWKITTVEGLGSRKTGYHTLQAALAGMCGSQCGFCSPGWVMNMHSLTQNGKMTMKEIENSFASNICRCTGYRPILDTFKSFASDAPPMMKERIRDIEEVYCIRSCENCPKKSCDGTCKDLEIIYKSSIPRTLALELKDSAKFHKILEVDRVFELFVRNSKATYVLNGGNTAHGVYRLPRVQLYIDINDIPDLHRIEKERDSLILGGNVTLSTAKMTFEKYMNDPGFDYLKEMAKHVDLVASISIRNIGTIAGNLMIKNQNREFPSDIFLILETAGAQLHILDAPGSKFSVTLQQFLDLNMYQKIIYSVALPPLGKEYVYKTYKIMPRSQNAHAIVNAGFLFKLDGNGKVLQKPNIIFGGIRPDFLHATKTEEYLQGKSIFDVKILQMALETLKSELNPDHVLPDFKPEYRKLLAICLLYKFVLNVNPKKASPKLRSGAFLIQRELSSGKQVYDTDRNMWPVNQPMPKIESIYQTSGEGEYINDLIIRENEVFCALTLADTPGAFDKIESEEALDIDGVVAFYSAADIPGLNTFINPASKFFFMFDNEPLFADKVVKYAGQAYGMIVATSQNIAQYAASKVKLIYAKGPTQKAMVTIQDVLASNDKTRINQVMTLPAKSPPGKDVSFKIKGTHECGAQYHFSMESQTCVCVPIEDGIDVFSSTQWMDFTQSNIASVLAVPINSINMKVRRLGGAYGAKITRATQFACACALACHKLRQPTRLVLTIEDNMRTVGKRPDTLLEYDMGFDASGKIQFMDMTYYGNAGASFNDTSAFAAAFNLYNCYDVSTWTVNTFDCKTDLPGNTWCRAPGAAEGISMTEHIMERIARVTGKDPLEVRLKNMSDGDKDALLPMIDEIKKTSDYEKRLKDVKKFNTENRWNKRGISLVLMKFGLEIWGHFHSLVSIYARDGTVTVAHGGIEMGQGLHTKITQIVAYTLGIDLKMVSVKPSQSLAAPNNYCTGGALGSDTCGYATQMACKELNRRLQPIKDELGAKASWQEIVLTAHAKDVDMCASYMFTPTQEIKSYPVYGTTVAEVEVDMLTGLHLVHRVDILEDTGVSLSPEIDVGQVEGAFVMGMGMWLTEDLIYDPDTGALTNFRTWNYKVPGAKDIPVDFRVSFRRNSPNPLGVLRSKSAGEPPLCMSCSIPIAIRNALNSARDDAGNKDLWYQLDNTITPEKILLSSLTNIDGMVL